MRERLRLAVNVLRGRPVAYRLTVFGSIGYPYKGGVSHECEFIEEWGGWYSRAIMMANKQDENARKGQRR